MNLYLLDTNLPLRSIQADNPHHPAAVHAIQTLLTRGESLVVVPQVIYEFYVVCTRPETGNGLGLSSAEALAEISRLNVVIPVMQDNAHILDEWVRLVAAHDVKGKPAHDARLVAAMLVHGITHILTFNTGDFARYTDIIAVHPDDV